MGKIFCLLSDLTAHNEIVLYENHSDYLPYKILIDINDMMVKLMTGWRCKVDSHKSGLI
jgi:hypothetical protein